MSNGKTSFYSGKNSTQLLPLHKHKLVASREYEKPKPYALSHGSLDSELVSKNKDINKFQSDVVSNIYFPTQLRRTTKHTKQDAKLKEQLENHLLDPANNWQPKDHSRVFMKDLRKY